MRRIALAAVLGGGAVWAGNSVNVDNPFTYSRDYVRQEFAPVDEIANYLIKTKNPSLDEIQSTARFSIKELNTDMEAISSIFEPPLGIPSFIWGFCLGWVGILIVYLVTEDKDETKKALLGCVVGGLTYFLFYIVLWVWILGNVAFWAS